MAFTYPPSCFHSLALFILSAFAVKGNSIFSTFCSCPLLPSSLLFSPQVQEAEGEKRNLSADGEALRKTIVELKAQKEALNRSLAQVKEEREAATQGKEFYVAETEKLGRLKGEVEQERDYYREESAKFQAQSTSMEQERDLYREKSADVRAIMW